MLLFRSWPENGEIEFKRYATRYRPELDLVLREIDVKVESKQKVCLSLFSKSLSWATFIQKMFDTVYNMKVGKSY